MEKKEAVIIDGEKLSLEDVRAVALEGAGVSLSPQSRKKMNRSLKLVGRWIKDEKIVYGISTGFGGLSDVLIPPGEQEQLQHNLIKSHCAGVGPPFTEEVVRAMMLLRANSLARGNSGIRPLIVDALIEFLNRGITPVVPSRGSVGASGDLAPLAHLASALLGEGEVTWHGKTMRSSSALKKAGLEPLRLAPKEGLALINGTQAMSSILCLALKDLETLLYFADAVASLSFYATGGNPAALSPLVSSARPHPGQKLSAERLLAFLSGRDINSFPRVQDSYSFRCIPQVHGPVNDLYDFARRMLVIEINSVTDNPLVFPDEEEIISGGNFHGAPLGLAADSLAVGVCYLGGISERRTYKMLDSSYSGLPRFLAKEEGLSSGLMLCQYTAAALVSENKVLAHPSSIDSIPTSAGQEDHVSMGLFSCLKLSQMIAKLRYILAIEWIVAAEAAGYKEGHPPRALKKLYDMLRKEVPEFKEDRPPKDAIEKAVEMIDKLTACGLADSLGETG
ncbi:MAG: histidine ammonia-lyase [Chloroflexi bacterium]|nr:histidine ammonia-lyase [Chloroflexota bacterium]